MSKNTQEKKTFTALSIEINVDTGKIIVGGFNEGDESSVNLYINYKEYDKDHSPKFFETDDSIKRADDTLTELFGKTLQEVLDDKDCLLGVDFDCYTDDAGHGYANPKKEYISWSKLDSAGKMALKNLFKTKSLVMSTPLRDARSHGKDKEGKPYATHRFELGIPVEIDGETKNYRISQITCSGDTKGISLDYKGSCMGGFKNERGFKVSDAEHKILQFENDMWANNPDLGNKILKMANSELDETRKEVVDRVQAETGYNLEDVIAENNGDGGSLPIVDIDIQKVGGGESMWIAATIEPKVEKDN